MAKEIHYYRKNPVKGLVRARNTGRHSALYRLVMRLLKRGGLRGKE